MTVKLRCYVADLHKKDEELLPIKFETNILEKSTRTLVKLKNVFVNNFIATSPVQSLYLNNRKKMFRSLILGNLL